MHVARGFINFPTYDNVDHVDSCMTQHKAINAVTQSVRIEF